MKKPDGIWIAYYKHDFRKHTHRCRQCNRVIKTGEQVWMARIEPRKTKAIHFECGEKIATHDVTAAVLLAAHAIQFIEPKIGNDENMKRAATLVERLIANL